MQCAAPIWLVTLERKVMKMTKILAVLTAILLMATTAQALSTHALFYSPGGALNGQTIVGSGLGGVTDDMGSFGNSFFSTQAATGDLDGDGTDEIIYYGLGTDGGGVAAYAMTSDGSGGWIQGVTNIGAGAWGGAADYRAHVGDIGGNGDADLIIFDPSGGTLLARNFAPTGSGGWGVFPTSGSESTLNDTGTVGARTAVGDVDGDGAVEWVEYNTGNVTVYPLVAPGSGTDYTLGSGITAGPNWGDNSYTPIMADLDGDGKDEFLICNPADGTWLGRAIVDDGSGGLSLGDSVFSGSWTSGSQAMVGTFQTVVIPEPASMAFLALGGLAMLRRRRSA